MKRIAITALTVCMAAPSFAISVARGGGFSAARSFSSPRPSYTARPAPRPTYAPPPRPVVVKKTTIVQQNVTHVQQPSSSSGGFFAPFMGAVAGSVVGDWLFGHKEKEQAAPQPAPAPAQPAQ